MSVPDESADRLSPRTRTILVWGLMALGALILLVGSLTVWVKRQALDTDAWVDSSTQLLDDPDVRNALSIYVVDQLYEYGDIEGRLEERLPPNLAGLAAPIAGSLRTPAEEAVNRLLESPRFLALWENVNRIAHETLLRVLEDETRAGVSTAEGNVTLDLRTFLVTVGNELGIGEQLEQRLPEDAGQITILKSDQLEAAQTTLKVIKVLSWLVVFLAIAAFAGAIWLARDRRGMLTWVGVVLLLVGILLGVIRRVAGNYLVDALAQGESIRDAAGSAWLIGTSLLIQIAWALVIYGIVILIGSALAGPSRVARRIRGVIGPPLRDYPGAAWAVLAGLYPPARALGAGAGAPELARRARPRRARRDRLRGVPAPHCRRARERRPGGRGTAAARARSRGRAATRSRRRRPAAPAPRPRAGRGRSGPRRRARRRARCRPRRRATPAG